MALWVKTLYKVALSTKICCHLVNGLNTKYNLVVWSKFSRWDVRPDGWRGLSRLRGWKWAGTSTSILAPCLRWAALSSWQDFTNGGEAFLQVRLLLMFWRGKHFPNTYLFKAKIRIFLKLIFGVAEGMVLVAKKVHGYLISLGPPEQTQTCCSKDDRRKFITTHMFC